MFDKPAPKTSQPRKRDIICLYPSGFGPPIRPIDFSDPFDKSRHDRMVSLVERMLDLNKELGKAKTAHDQTVLKRQIDATDKQIDQLVYELYGLTNEEIRVVEETNK